MAVAFTSIPVIDVSALFQYSIDTPEGLEKRKGVAEELCRACSDIGFLQITHYLDHLTPEEKVDMEDLLHFFKCPEDIKHEVSKKTWNPQNSNMYRGYFPVLPNTDSYKEGIEFGPEKDLKLSVLERRQNAGDNTKLTKIEEMILEENIWPDRLLEWSAAFDWRAKMRKYFEIMLRLGIELMRGIAQGLGLSPNFFDDKFNDSISTLRLLHYPDPPEENKISPSSSSPLALSVDAGGANCQLDSSLLRLSCSQHTDSGILTLLWQDSVGGLQAQNGVGQWVPVTPTEGALVINIGDLLQRWTNGRFVATVHRVLYISAERFSVPFFFEPNFDAVIEPIPSVGGGSSDYPPVTYGSFLIEKMKCFAEYKHLTEQQNE